MALLILCGCGKSTQSSSPSAPAVYVEPAPSMKNLPEALSDTQDESGQTVKSSLPTKPEEAAPPLAQARIQAHLFEDRFQSMKNFLLAPMNDFRDRLQHPSTSSAPELFAKRESAKSLSVAENKCLSAYQTLYQNPELRVRVALGYFNYDYDEDADDANVFDPSSREQLEEYLMQPCADQTYLACEFTKDEKTGNLEKTIVGPDLKPRKLILEIQNSANTVSDSNNRIEGRNQQLAQSASSKSFFLDGFTQSDVLIYGGHSRDGGGPSFEPPRLIRERSRACRNSKLDHMESCIKNGLETDYDWYHHHRVGEQAMLQAISRARSKQLPKMLVLASCFSENHFGAHIRAAAPKMALFTTRSLIANTSISGMILTTIQSLARQSCRQDMIQPLVMPDFRDDDHQRLDGNPTVVGFF